jgi:hypothetical protein
VDAVTSASNVTGAENGRLGVLVEAELALEKRLAAHRIEAGARVRSAQLEADEYVLAQSRACTASGTAQLEMRRRELDEQLAAESRSRREELDRAMSALDVLRDELCARMLAELLLLP